jgi:hypothetical protein
LARMRRARVKSTTWPAWASTRKSPWTVKTIGGQLLWNLNRGSFAESGLGYSKSIFNRLFSRGRLSDNLPCLAEKKQGVFRVHPYSQHVFLHIGPGPDRRPMRYCVPGRQTKITSAGRRRDGSRAVSRVQNDPTSCGRFSSRHNKLSFYIWVKHYFSKTFAI